MCCRQRHLRDAGPPTEPRRCATACGRIPRRAPGSIGRLLRHPCASSPRRSMAHRRSQHRRPRAWTRNARHRRARKPHARRPTWPHSRQARRHVSGRTRWPQAWSPRADATLWPWSCLRGRHKHRASAAELPRPRRQSARPRQLWPWTTRPVHNTAPDASQGQT